MMSIKISLPRIAQLWVGIALTFVLINISPISVQAQSPEWSEPTLLSSAEGFAWFPDVTTDLTGGIHVFWASGRQLSDSKFNGYDTVVYCQPAQTGCSTTLEVAALVQLAGEYNTRPAAVVDSQGTLHLLWRGETAIFYTSTSVIEPASARNWTTPHRISGRNTAYYLNIAQDQRGVLHAVWSENMPANNFEKCLFCSDLFYRQSADLGRTWSAPVDLSNSPWSSEKPQIVFGPDEQVYVVWEEGHDFYNSHGEPQSSMAVASLDGGLTWGKPTTFIFPGDVPQAITAGVDAQGKLVVVWQQVAGFGIFYQVSADQGQSWSMPRPVPGVMARSFYSDLEGYDMAVDSAGHLHLVLTGRDAQAVSASVNQPGSKGPPNSVYHLEWDGSNWSAPTPIFTSMNGDLPEWPRIAVANGNQLHVVWFNRDLAHINNSEGGKYQIWYNHGISSAPAVAPVTWPTPSPTPTPVTIPTPTLIPTVVPTPIPIGTLAPDLAQLAVPLGAKAGIYSDNDDVLLVAVSLLPAILIIVLVIVRVRYWRR